MGLHNDVCKNWCVCVFVCACVLRGGAGKIIYEDK